MERARGLLGGGRLDLAEEELRRALAGEPQNATAHLLLSLCLSARLRYAEATQEAHEAVRLAPHVAFAHYALARGRLGQARPHEAASALEEALRLDPGNADFYELLGLTRLRQEDQEGALSAAAEGLGIDPEHVGCSYLLARALASLGRRDEAGPVLYGIAARDPENVLQRCREALRLDPTLEWAHQGIMDVWSAQHPLQGLVLRHLHTVSNWRLKLWWWPPWPVALILLKIALLFVLLNVTLFILTLTARQLAHLLLRLHPVSQWVLSPEEIAASRGVAACLAAALAMGGASVASGEPALLVVAVMVVILGYPVAALFRSPPFWPRLVMAGYTALLAGPVLGWVILPRSEASDRGLLLLLSAAFLVGVIATNGVARLSRQ